jgi:citrate lyase subunit beta/citryl-CoA lyase
MATKILRKTFFPIQVRAKPAHQLFLLQNRTFSESSDVAQLRRSVHFVPGDNLKFLSKSLTLGADTLILDLEDSVKDKELGRRTVREFLDSLPASGRSEVLVRINPLSGSYWREDVEASFHNADGFMIPKVESREELQMLDDFLLTLEKQDGSTAASKPKVLLPIATETPQAVLNIAEIAKGPRVCAITWGCEDLSAELGSYGTRNSNGYLDIFSHCRHMCLLAAKAAGVQAIDGIYQNIRDTSGFEKESNDAKYMGFDGKLTLHPNQIPLLHNVFEPSKEEMNEANAIIKLWEGEGDKGAVEYNGKMIDMPHYMRAKKVMARCSYSGDSKGSATPATMTTKDDLMIRQPNQNTTDEGTTKDAGNEVFPRVCMGKYFEDLEPGLTIRHFLTRTVTESDNVFFTCLTMNPAPIHLDHELSKGNSAALSGVANNTNSNAGKPLFNSMFTLALLVGMSVPEATHGTTVANLGFSEVLFPKPVYPGDTLRAETVVLDRRESKSRPTQGIVTLQHLAYNQKGEVVCKATRQALMKRGKI